nr:transposase family protein [Actinomyces sp. oral taxon 414]
MGKGMITPHKKPPNGELSEAAEEANKSISRIRQVVEQTIAHIKAWRILHTDYRRPLHTFEQTITAALSLYVFKTTL